MSLTLRDRLRITATDPVAAEHIEAAESLLRKIADKVLLFSHPAHQQARAEIDALLAMNGGATVLPFPRRRTREQFCREVIEIAEIETNGIFVLQELQRRGWSVDEIDAMAEATEKMLVGGDNGAA